jgi:hypothetical protein
MVTPVSTGSFLQNISNPNVSVVSPVAPVTTTTPNVTTASTTPATSPATTSGTPQLPSSILALLQAFLSGDSSGSSSSSDPLAALLGGGNSSTSNSDPLASLLGGSSTTTTDPLTQLIQNGVTTQVYSSVLSAAYDGTGATNAPANDVQSLIASLNTASNAYNTTLLQNAQSVAAANNFEADGKTPLPITSSTSLTA